MSDTPPKPSHPVRNTGITVVVVLLLYVLSYGPAGRLMLQGKFSQEKLDAAYAPLIWLIEHDHYVTRPFFEWYVWLWIKDAHRSS